MRSAYLTIDLETVIDPLLPPRDEAKDRDGLPPASYHRVVAAGMVLIEDYVVTKIGAFVSLDEKKVLTDITATIDKRESATVVTFNGRGFDMPVLVARCLRHGVPFRRYFRERDMRYRFSDKGHYDLSEELSDFGASKRASVDVFAKSIGLPGKMSVDGKQVGALFEAGKYDEIGSYVCTDVAQETGLLFRVLLLRGILTRETYVVAMQSLLRHVDTDDRLAEMRPLCNRPRLLLEEA